MKLEEEFIFVYGTLCERAMDSMCHLLKPEAEFVSMAMLQAKLYMVDYYPAVIDSSDPKDLVQGELYKASELDTLFLKLDEYEGCSLEHPSPQEYRREKRKVKNTKGEEFEAWTYIFNLAIDQFVHIESGDFLEFQRTVYLRGRFE